MPTAEKAQVIEKTKAKYQKAAGVIFAEYRGLKVHQLQALRAQLKEKGGEFSVVKNTLFRIAIGDDADNLPEELNSGPTAVAFLYDNEPEITKLLLDFAKVNKALVVKGGFIGGKPVSDKQVESFSKLPPRDVLVAQVIGAIAAPLSTLVGTIEALYADPIRVIGAVADKVAEGSPLPEKAETDAPVEAVAAQDAAPAAPVAGEAADADAAPAAPAEAEATDATDAKPTADATPAAEEAAPTPAVEDGSAAQTETEE